MTQRLAIIGNSHIGAVNAAYRADPSLLSPQFAPTFFGSAGNQNFTLEPSGTRLIPGLDSVVRNYRNWTGGDGSIETKDFDMFLLVGLTWRIPRAPIGTSSQMLDAIVAEQFKTTMCFTYARALRQLTDAPIYAMPHPLRTPRFSNANLVTYKAIFDRFVEVAKDLNMTLLRQPKRTRIKDMSTKPHFRRSDEDFSHMNADYGRIRLTNFARKVRDADADAPS